MPWKPWKSRREFSTWELAWAALAKWPPFVAASEWFDRRHNPPVNEKWDKARKWAKETAEARYTKGERLQPGALASRVLQPHIAENLEEFGLDEVPTAATVTGWIKDKAPPELRSKHGVPRKS